MTLFLAGFVFGALAGVGAIQAFAWWVDYRVERLAHPKPPKWPEEAPPEDDFAGGPSAEWEMHFGQATSTKC